MRVVRIAQFVGLNPATMKKRKVLMNHPFRTLLRDLFVLPFLHFKDRLFRVCAAVMRAE